MFTPKIQDMALGPVGRVFQPTSQVKNDDEGSVESEKMYPLPLAFIRHENLRTETVGLNVDGVPDIHCVCASAW